jgi:predicted nucleotide-binding protein (sugar kinase/HSP70/actin superfamily)
MYEAEYRLALRNAGFDGFRVLLFQQKGGLKQGDLEAGLKMDLDFFMGMLNAFNAGDLLSEVANQIRAFETTRARPTRRSPRASSSCTGS